MQKREKVSEGGGRVFVVMEMDDGEEEGGESGDMSDVEEEEEVEGG